ncbi:hypothetical protein [Aquipuribacter nitratireducens]|uniref:Uncharacterized protein n=1 Tax=Aquipuribacter nitratireducens TaxID=650104 RepID=A0ABW0GTY3_9MICO
MSTQPFGQPGPIGGPSTPPPPPPPVADEAPSGSRKTVVIAVAAGVAALGVLGAGAALVLTGAGGADGEASGVVPPASVAPVEPSATATAAPASPLPTAVIKGRNVFVPLVEEGEAASGAGTEAATAPPATSGSTTSTGALPGSTTAPTSAPTSGTGFTPLPVVEYIEVTVTETVKGDPVPGPTATETVTAPAVEVPVPGATFERLRVVVEARDVLADDGVTVIGTEYPADFYVDKVLYEDVLPEDPAFGEKEEFIYVSYSPSEQKLLFSYGSALFSVVVPVTTP